MGKSRKNPPRKGNARVGDVAKRVVDAAAIRLSEALAHMDKKLIGFVQAFQQNLNQLYMNQKSIGDMSYTNNVHVAVLREVMYDKGLLTKEEYEAGVEKELAVREAIQKKQAEEAEQLAEELRKKQAEEAAARIAAEAPAPSEEVFDPQVFGGDFKEEAIGQAVQGE